MDLIKYASNTIVLRDKDKYVDSKLLNLVIDEILDGLGEIDHKGELERSKRVNDDYIIVCGYGSIIDNRLFTVVKNFLEFSSCVWTESVLEEEEIKALHGKLPILNIRTGSQCGGINEDSREIDPGVKPLSDAFNKFSGIETFSSCEGHIHKNSGTFYILFTAEKMEDLATLTYYLDRNMEKVLSEYQDLIKPTQIMFRFDYGHWPHIKNAYFEVRIIYPEHVREILFEAMKVLAVYILNDKDSSILDA